MTTSTGIFEVERGRDALIVTPTVNIGELAFQQIEFGTAAVLEELNDSAVCNVVIDLRSTDYFGTTAVSFFLKLWERVRERNGRMIFCNVSEHEHELLRLSKLESLWGMAGSREEALRLVRR
jgi:anti-anti-sigma factor